MYYNNKSTFYIHNYGPTVIIAIISLILIGSGVYIYLSIDTLNNKASIVTTTNESSAQDSLDNIVATNTNESNDVLAIKKVSTNTKKNKIYTITEDNTVKNELEALKKGEKSLSYKIYTITDKGSIILGTDKSRTEIYLAGIDYSSMEKDTINKLNSDLTGKNVNIVFDTTKIDNNNLIGFVFINNNLYNELVLKNGYFKYKDNIKDESVITILKKAQEQAKSTKVGLYKN